ncbi:MAG: hypothetical protein AAF721_23470 [Myxococcota bacterium]
MGLTSSAAASARPKAQAADDKPKRPVVLKEFRILDWNAAGNDCGFNGGQDQEVAQRIKTEAAAFNANVITLQEFSAMGMYHLEEALDASWECHPFRFGDNLLVTCVKGTAANPSSTRLSGERFHRLADWWGYVQLEFQGVQITNVHTRATWADRHVEELHDKVTTGIIAGDFNTEVVGWNQTASQLEPTWQDRKLDHILTIEQPQHAVGGAHEKFGSNHRMVRAVIKWGPPRVTKPKVRRRVRRRRPVSR